MTTRLPTLQRLKSADSSLFLPRSLSYLLANCLGSAEFLTAAVFAGMLMGGVVAGIAADRLGRRFCLLISLSVTLTFGALSAAAPSIGWLIAARVVAGVGEPRD